jgi:hypothetical protein
MRATWRPLSTWPYEPRRRIRGERFRSGWEVALEKVEEEIGRLKGDDVVIGVVVDPAQIGFSGQLKAGGRTRFGHAGVEISFDVPDGRRLVFHTDAYDTVTANLRAIGLGLEALRAVDRYGITSTSEQYAGFAMLGPGGPDPERGRKIAIRVGSVTAALRATHPDTRADGYTDRDFADVQAYRDTLKPVPA